MRLLEVGQGPACRVGPGNPFPGCGRTMAHYETAFRDSRTADSDTFETWSEAGGEDAIARVNRRWKILLVEYQGPALDEGIDESLRDFIARREAAMRDAWY